jgi:hypothetical protein
MAENKHPVAFALEGKREGVEITPATIGFAQFNRFNKEMADFVAGDAQGGSLDDCMYGWKRVRTAWWPCCRLP